MRYIVAREPRGRVGVQLRGLTAAGEVTLKISARVVRTREDDGVGLAFEGYDEALNDYLDHVYAERLTRESEPLAKWWAES